MQINDWGTLSMRSDSTNVKINFKAKWRENNVYDDDNLENRTIPYPLPFKEIERVD